MVTALRPSPPRASYDRGWPGEHPAGGPPPPPGPGTAAAVLAMVSGAAGLTHLAAASGHFSESTLHGAFFATVGVFQLATAAALLGRTRRPLLAAVAAGNAVVVAVWILSRTAGVPDAESGLTVGLADAVATALEAVLVIGSLVLLAAAGRPHVAAGGTGRVAALVTTGAVLLLLTPFTLVDAATHDHDEGRAHGEEAAGVHGHGPDGITASGEGTVHAAGHAVEEHTVTGAGGTGTHGHEAPAAVGGAHTATGHGSATGSHGSHAPGPEAAANATAPATAAPPARPTTADVRQATVRYGPVPLGPSLLGTPATASGIAPVFPKPCSDCYVTGTTIDLVFEDGRSANLDEGVMLHHVVLAQRGLQDATCGPDTALGALGQRFFAAGNERTAGALPAGFGYHIGQGPLLAIFDLMNHSATPRVVYVAATVSYVPDTTPGIKPVTPLWLDENNCGTSQYAVPAGPSNQVWRWRSTITGRVLAAAGHVHDGGIKTVLSNESTGRTLCTSYAGYGTKPAYMGSIESMSTCVWDRLGTVRAGEVLALDTYYDSAEAQTDAMGIMIAYVYETDDLAGGTDPPAPGPPPPTNKPGPGHMH